MTLGWFHPGCTPISPSVCHQGLHLLEAPPPSPDPASWAGAGAHRRLRGPSCPAAVVPPPHGCPQVLLRGGWICGSPDQADGPAPTTSSSPGGRVISLFYPRRFPQPLTILVLVVTVLVTRFTSQAHLPCERRGWTWGPFHLGTPGLQCPFWETRLYLDISVKGVEAVLCAHLIPS